jgi:uncharacterized protein (DUF1800 family)
MKPRVNAVVIVPMTFSFPPDKAWQPLPPADWNREAARHLLRRAGWTALPEDTDRAMREGLDATLQRLFPTELPLLPKPRAIERLEDAAPALQREVAGKTGEERQRAQREAQERGRLALQELSLQWLAYAAQPENSAGAKWTLFLSDVYVVSAEKVRNAALVYQHFDILGRHAMGSAPALTKAVSRSPAMVIYLDLNQSQRKAPNENFARELFELFVLGEGNYTEQDIKEAARAFTGYRAQPLLGEFRYVAAQHDPTPKTVFGATGAFTGDDVIDLAYQQKAAASFLPHEMVKFYLSDTPLPPEYLAALGEEWRASEWNLRTLAHRFFGSRLFFAPEFRANFIKSPLQFYLGAVQDLQLDVAPLPRIALNPMRQMGQWLFYPPNVRGWVGGHNWINSATITARRQLAESLFAPIDEKSLNADELVDLVAARTNGVTHFTVSDDQLAPLAEAAPADAAARLTAEFLASSGSPAFQADLAEFVATNGADPKQRLRRVRRAAVTLLASPEYQLC